ncbi:dienelactone hydrolase family protein [Actinoplanes derwentensis]|uniref:Carboxymethylenebutenolidase n=1 Tax=Actinoplanes derwentensis TaxID=113562 RepID=A0A1H2DC48_9ACTN|nr:dienelactone hydrolase family protein [Actinoplanes derwentensis]GID90207.1 carboxymethylenebutenolidase [Actinoplanes derwentensis]SDT80325.1 carboxymethylenebutenolidase [Actinoplanes derwentensis]
MADPNSTASAATTEWVTVPTPDGPMRVYTARPAAPADRAVIVLQEAFGVNDHIQDITRRYAARGFLAVAPDLFHRNGVGTLDYQQHAEAMPLIGAIGVEAVITDVGAVLAYLGTTENIGAGRTAVHGFCFGGRAAFTAATAIPGLGATVVFYGPGIAAGPHAVLDRAKFIDAPMLLHVGAQDPTIPADQVAAIDKALTDAGVEFDSYVYDNAGHAFACDARPHMYHAEPAQLAWQRTHEFLERHLPAGA